MFFIVLFNLLTHKLFHCCLLFFSLFFFCYANEKYPQPFIRSFSKNMLFTKFFLLSLVLKNENFFLFPNRTQYLFFHEFELSLSYAFRSRVELMASQFCAIHEKRFNCLHDGLVFFQFPGEFFTDLQSISYFHAHWKEFGDGDRKKLRIYFLPQFAKCFKCWRFVTVWMQALKKLLAWQVGWLDSNLNSLMFASVLGFHLFNEIIGKKISFYFEVEKLLPATDCIIKFSARRHGSWNFS